MPRTQITISDTIEYISILDEHGSLDSDLEPEIPSHKHIEIYRSMLLGRRFDERMLNLQRQGRIGTFPPIKGQEASQIGSVCQLQENDWFVPSFRETAAEIMRGRSLESVLLYYNGFNEGTIIPSEQRDMPMAVPVASQIPHAAGLGYAAAYRKSGEVVMAFFGDGATSEGDFHEGLNCAAVYQCPVIFICQNNHWAISIPVNKQTRSKTIAQKAVAYGMPGIQVDGNDVLAVYSATREAIERARSGGGPTLIECVTYRVMMHTTADDPSRYRAEDEVESWRNKDPLKRYAKYLSDKGLLDTDLQAELENDIESSIEAAVKNAEHQMSGESSQFDIFNHLFSELPPHIKRQQEQAARHFKAENSGRGAA